MRHGEALIFWTGLGAALMGSGHARDAIPAGRGGVLPDPLPEKGPRAGALLGSPCSRSRARHICERSWEILAPMGWSRALRLEPWPGRELFLPFHRGGSAVIPQGFSVRVPPLERALALVGKSAASRLCGVELTVVLATWSGDVIDLLSEGGTRCCSLDRLAEALKP